MIQWCGEIDRGIDIEIDIEIDMSPYECGYCIDTAMYHTIYS